MVGRWFARRDRNTTRKKFNIRFFRLDTLRIATNNFSTFIGRGGFGSVFKGVLPDDGTTVAVKRTLKPYDGFLEMVEFMSHLRHINLIRVIGCCVENGEQILVCEYADNGSVWGRLHGENRPSFDWETRAAVCIGIAHALSYLHEEISPRVIHRDIKPANILLDANLVPKITDFDLMYVVGANLENTSTHTTTTTTVKGTLAYLDPNYILRGQLTEKVDVYSFGLTILEIITGRRAVDLAPEEGDDRMILNWMILNWVKGEKKEGIVWKIVDPKLTDIPKEDVERFINVALLCTRATSEERPSMFEVVHMLYGRHKSDQEISDMAAKAIADQPAQWSTTVSKPSVTISNSSIGIDCEAEMESREERDEGRSIAPKKKDGECSSKAELGPAVEDVVREYFERSMEKIMRFNVAVPGESDRTTTRNQTTVMKRSSENMFMEAVYPPFLSGEYRTARLLYSQRPTPL